MTRISVLIFFLFTAAFGLRAQDTLFLTDRNFIREKINEMNSYSAKYNLQRANGTMEFRRMSRSEMFGKKSLLEGGGGIPYSNVLLLNLFDPLDGSMGLTYGKVLYRSMFSTFGSLSMGWPGSKSYVSNAFLLEQTVLYTLTHKNMDASLNLNVHVSLQNLSFSTFGLMIRLSQFEGNYHGHNFVLNRYSGYFCFGQVGRGGHGLTFMYNFALGHYENDYIANNPWPLIRAEKFNMREIPWINSVVFSVKIGGSF